MHPLPVVTKVIRYKNKYKQHLKVYIYLNKNLDG